MLWVLLSLLLLQLLAAHGPNDTNETAGGGDAAADDDSGPEVAAALREEIAVLRRQLLLTAPSLPAPAPPPPTSWPFTQAGLGMARQQTGLAQFDEGCRAFGGWGSVAIRGYTSTGIKNPSFPPLSDEGGGAVGPGFQSMGGYSFNLAFRDELSGALIKDSQDELDMQMLYPDQQPDDSNCTHGRLNCSTLEEVASPPQANLVLPHQDTLWEHNRITRTANWHKTINNVQTSFSLRSILSVAPSAPELYQEITIHNRLDRPLHLTVIPDQHAHNRSVGGPNTFVAPTAATFHLHGGRYQPADMHVISDIGPATRDGWLLRVPAVGNVTFRIALRLCMRGPEYPHPPHSSKLPPGNCSAPFSAPFFDANLSQRVAAAQEATKAHMASVAAGMPHVASGNRQLDEFFARSVLSVMLCRLTNPEFAVTPFYILGSQHGVSTNWDFSFAAGTLSWIDPRALEGMMRLFFTVGVQSHSYVFWDGTGGGSYAQGPFSGMEMVQRYMDTAGDRDCLEWKIDNLDSKGRLLPGGKVSILQRLIEIGAAMKTQYGRSRADGLFDIGAGTGKMLEIEEDDYQHAIGAINAMAVNYYSTLSKWCHDAGNASCATQFGLLGEKLNEQLQAKLWDEEMGWYGNLYPNETQLQSARSTRTVLSYHTLEALKSFGPEVFAAAVPASRRARMLERFVPGELLAPFGLWSISRSDIKHWSREDCDWGGGGQYVGQTGRLTELLFTVQRPDLGWQVLRRMARWVERFPYFPQTIYGDQLALQPHERNWYLQVSSGAGAQAVVNGAFGVRPQSGNATLVIAPHFNASMMAGDARLTNYHFRNATFSVIFNCTSPRVMCGFGVLRGGTSVLERQQPFGTVVHCRTSGLCVSQGP